MSTGTATEHRPADEVVRVLGPDGWVETTGDDRSTPRWVVVPDLDDLAAAARRHGLPDDAVLALERRGPGVLGWSNDHPLRARVERAPSGAGVLRLPTLTYVEESRDVHTGAVACVVCDDVVLTAETGDADVLGHAAKKLTSGVPVPETGARQVMAAVLLTLAAIASDVEIGLGEAVADTEQVVFSRASGDPVEQIYDLKREIAEARRALGPVAALLPDLLADLEDDPDAASALPWLRRLQAATDRYDRHLDGHDRLLGDMLSAHLSRVSVRQNEDMRKISAWAAIAAVPTLVAGIYGMNFHHMPELTWTFGYPLALAFMGGVCWVLYRVFRRSGWL